MSESITKSASMKKLEIVIRPGKLDAVKKAMATAGYTGLTISQAEGHGNQKGATHSNGGFRMDLMPKLLLRVVVPETDVEKLIDAIARAAQTGEVGDGKIFISDIREVIRIRTGERGLVAL